VWSESEPCTKLAFTGDDVEIRVPLGHMISHHVHRRTQACHVSLPLVTPHHHSIERMASPMVRAMQRSMVIWDIFSVTRVDNLPSYLLSPVGQLERESNWVEGAMACLNMNRALSWGTRCASPHIGERLELGREPDSKTSKRGPSQVPPELIVQ
jgi:hypothetical protein